MMFTAGFILAGLVLLGVLVLGLYEAGRNFIWDSLDRFFSWLVQKHILERLFKPHVFTPKEEEARRSSDEHPTPDGLGVTTTQKNEPWVYKPGREK